MAIQHDYESGKPDQLTGIHYIIICRVCNLGESQVAQSCTWQYPVCSPAMNAEGQMLLELRHVVPEK